MSTTRFQQSLALFAPDEHSAAIVTEGVRELLAHAMEHSDKLLWDTLHVDCDQVRPGTIRTIVHMRIDGEER